MVRENTTDCDSDDESQDRNRHMQRIAHENQDHVTVSCTIDTSDMNEHETEVLQKLSNLYEESFREVYEKNRDYGWSFLKTGCSLAATDATPFDSPVKSQTYGLLTRTGDKRERLKENVYGDGDTSVSDHPSQTATETANYWFFISLVLDNPELASDFLYRSDGSESVR